LNTRELKGNFCTKKINELNQLLKAYRFDEADKLYAKYRDVIKITTYEEMRDKYLNNKNKEKIFCTLKELLKVGNFSNADKLF